MEVTSLYKLPKDLLVKMICMIKEEMRKEYQERVDDLEDKVRDAEYLGVKYSYCAYPECKKHNASNYKIKINDLHPCASCKKEFCEQHITFCEICEDTVCLDDIVICETYHRET